VNILVNMGDSESHIQLCDFGASRVLDNVRGATTEYKFSVDYIAPELLDSDHDTAEGDMYAFGCVLMEVLYSTKASRSTTDVFVKRKSHKDNEKPQYVQGRHWNLTTRLWAVNPCDRPTASQVLGDLKLLRNHNPAGFLALGRRSLLMCKL